MPYKRISILRDDNNDLVTVGGKRIVDPEGKIVKFSWYSATGYFSYGAQVYNQDGTSHVAYKTMDIAKGGEPRLIATAKKRVYTDRDGKSYQADAVMLKSTDLLLLRGDTVLIVMSADRSTRVISLPPEFHRVPDVYEQHDDISYSRHLLIERYVGPS